MISGSGNSMNDTMISESANMNVTIIGGPTNSMNGTMSGTTNDTLNDAIISGPEK
jgi:hypothetical protein